jgi:hypothetical protein
LNLRMHRLHTRLHAKRSRNHQCYLKHNMPSPYCDREPTAQGHKRNQILETPARNATFAWELTPISAAGDIEPLQPCHCSGPCATSCHAGSHPVCMTYTYDCSNVLTIDALHIAASNTLPYAQPITWMQCHTLLPQHLMLTRAHTCPKVHFNNYIDSIYAITNNSVND